MDDVGWILTNLMRGKMIRVADAASNGPGASELYSAPGLGPVNRDQVASEPNMGYDRAKT